MNTSPNGFRRYLTVAALSAGILASAAGTASAAPLFAPIFGDDPFFGGPTGVPVIGGIAGLIPPTINVLSGSWGQNGIPAGSSCGTLWYAGFNDLHQWMTGDEGSLPCD